MNICGVFFPPFENYFTRKKLPSFNGKFLINNFIAEVLCSKKQNKEAEINFHSDISLNCSQLVDKPCFCGNTAVLFLFKWDKIVMF